MKQVVLVNYGGPEKPSEVRDYLYRLFSDRNVVRLPAGVVYQKLLARMISGRRAARVGKNYEAIGGSPLPSITRSLVRRLNRKGGHRYCEAMAYTRPFIRDVLERLPEKEVHVFPLFPHFSGTTTGACLSQAGKSGKKVFYFKEYWSDPEFNSLILRRIKDAADGSENPAVLLSAHSIPLKYAERGDPYLESVFNHFEMLKSLLPGFSVFLGFQSRVGPLKWAGPELQDVLRRIEQEGFRHVILYPLSFVVDSYETMFEIDVLCGDGIPSHGGRRFTRISCLNDSKDFVSFIEKKAEEEEWSELP